MERSKLLTGVALAEPADEELMELVTGLEEFASPESEVRRSGLARLRAADLHRRSPLAAALLASSIVEPNLSLRKEIVVALAEIVAASQLTPLRVRLWTHHALASMRRREVYALLQVAAASPGHAGLAHTVLGVCSFAGQTLTDILRDRSVDVQIRIAAVRAIGSLGYLAAAPVVETLQNRIATRSAGQQELGFAPELEAEAAVLLPALREVGHMLEETAI